MDSFGDRLRSLTHNKYFAYMAVIFFAFLTALIFALFALQSGTTTSSDSIRDSVNQGSASTGTTVQNQAPQEPQSALGRIISVITGQSRQSTTTTDSQDPQSGSTQNDGSTGSNDTTTAAETDKAETIDRILRASSPMPDISIDRYVLVTDLPQKPESIRIYQLKSNYTDAEVFDIADKLGFNSIDAVEKGSTVSQLYDLDDQHYLGFDTETGGFTFLTETGLTVNRQGSTKQQTAKNVLAQVGIDHASILPYATYKRSDDPGYTYVELHADWTRIGGPIINPIGFLNLPQNERVSGLSIGIQGDNSHIDEAVVETSDNRDGFSRADNFNTITVKISDADNKVYAMSTNIPQITSSESLGDTTIKSPIQAFDDYTKGQTSLAFTGPSGQGTVNLADVYSDNIASSTSVDVTDFEIVYAASQKGHPDWWCPSYAFRSFGQVQTGFEVQYGHLVPATSDPRCQTAVLGSNTQLAQAPTDSTVVQPTPDASRVVPTAIVGGPDKKASSLQYGSLGFKVRAVIDTPVSECPSESFNHSYTVKETPDYIDYVAWIDPNTRLKEPGRRFTARSWYFVRKKKAGSQATLESLSPNFSKSELFAFRSSAYRKGRIGDASRAPLDERFNGLETVSCQFIVTASPWIYTYNDTPLDVRVSLDPIGGVSYVNPAFTDENALQWNVTTTPDQHIVTDTGLKKSGLFWEYNRYNVLRAYEMNADKPTTGYIVPTPNIESFMTGLAHKLGLTEIETHNAVAELKRSSNKMTSPYVQVSFVSNDFLNEYLPMTVSPKPDSLSRIYFELTPRSSFDTMDQPTIPTVTRKGFTVVETGYIVRN